MCNQTKINILFHLLHLFFNICPYSFFKYRSCDRKFSVATHWQHHSKTTLYHSLSDFHFHCAYLSTSGSSEAHVWEDYSQNAQSQMKNAKPRRFALLSHLSLPYSYRCPSVSCRCMLSWWEATRRWSIWFSDLFSRYSITNSLLSVLLLEKFAVKVIWPLLSQKGSPKLDGCRLEKHLLVNFPIFSCPVSLCLL